MSDSENTLGVMTIDPAVVGFLVQLGNSPLGIAVLTALVLGTLRSIPELLRGFIRGIGNAPELIVLGV
jgi:hypothetical protein